MADDPRDKLVHKHPGRAVRPDSLMESAESWEGKDMETGTDTPALGVPETTAKINRRVKKTLIDIGKLDDKIGKVNDKVDSINRDLGEKILDLTSKTSEMAGSFKSLNEVLTSTINASQEITTKTLTAQLQTTTSRALAETETEKAQKLALINEDAKRSDHRRDVSQKIMLGIGAVWAVVSTALIAYLAKCGQ